MGSLCSKQKSSDSASVKSEGSNRKSSTEAIDNHSKKPPHLNGSRSKKNNGNQDVTDATPSTVIVSDTPESSLQARDPLRCRILRDAEPSSVSGDSVSLSSPTVLNAPHGADLVLPPKLPLEIKKQTDNIRNLLLGRAQRVKPVSKVKKVTIYVCSSDSQDYRFEKGDLHTQIYPTLREHCSNHGYELHIVDLHWKSDLENKQDHEFPELCLGELKRQTEVSHVVPVLFLSSSLGSPLLPKTMEQQDFELALKNITNPRSKDLLGKWYKLDTHAQPQCYRLCSSSKLIPQLNSENQDEQNEGISEWSKTVEEILTIMLQVFPTELRDIYLTTVIEQEIHNSIFMSREVGKRSIWVCRAFTNTNPTSVDLLSSIEIEKNRRLETLQNQLKNQLVSEHIIRHSVKWSEGGLSRDSSDHAKYLSELSNQLSQQLRNTLDEIIEEEGSKAKWKSYYGVDGSLCSEIMQHTIYCQQAAKCCIPYENVINEIKTYILNIDASTPLLLHGPKGSGKTCLLARAIQQMPLWVPECYLVFRFVGITPESQTLIQLLRTISSQIGYLINGRNHWVPHNLKFYQKELYTFNPSGSQVIIVIDGLDEVPIKDSLEASWLSEKLPSNIKLILSCSDGSPVFQKIKVHLPEKSFVSMPNLNEAGAESLLTTLILEYSHSIDSQLQKLLSSKFNQCLLPLYIKVLAWHASRSSQNLSGTTTAIKDPISAINTFFDYLEKVMGSDKVALTLGLLCSSRYGLSDSELLDLLAQTSYFSSKVTFVEWAPGAIFLAQLFQQLGPLMEWGVSGDTCIIRWRDSTVYDVAKERYIGTKEEESKSREILLNYFQGDIKDKKNGRYLNSGPDVTHRRSLEEVPYQHFYVKGSIKKPFLLNLNWLQKKIKHSTVYSVIEDIYLETNNSTSSSDPDIDLLCKTLELSSSALNYDGQQFYGQMYSRLLPYFKFTDGNDSQWKAKCPFMKSVFKASEKPNIPSFVPYSGWMNSGKNFESLLEKPIGDFDRGDIHFNEIYRMKFPSNQFVVSVSTAKEEIIVWDAYAETAVRTLKGVHNPNSLKIIDESRCVILCGRELNVFNLDSGTFIAKLKGVMNQKMPYYGLQDNNHIVAISRNRMYVNMMNLESGDCVTTFKVGEDRFLNSLIVSENGKILVCGDETQKPFPLLVWDLTSRKLLYDLRIPHHEFVTSLAAITKEGHFVCCVCREVDDPGPNFIVVYDLQSGTLFKKWKPGFSTMAIAISAQGGCVINSLEDNKIIVWDLVTGASQWTLEKHTSPPDVLKLDQKGSRCLSCDSTGRDRTVCLWDVTNGTLLALFTPDVPFTACEVLNNGDGVVLGLRGKPEIVSLTFRNGGSSGDHTRTVEKFGSEENHGKVIILNGS